MSLINSTAIPSGASAFEIEQSLRFDSDSSAYLSKTMAGDGSSRTTWTMSFWLKRGKLGTTQEVFRMHDDGNNHDPMWFEAADDTFHWEMFKGGGWFAGLVTNRVFRDTSAWYHIVLTFDTTQGTAANRLKMYINGVQETSFGTTYYPAQNSESLTNKSGLHHWGANNAGANEFDGYLAELHFIDGTALTPSSFGETGDYGEWKPKEVSGLTYGTNGYYLDFSNSSALGDDAAGNNDWAVNNHTASDQMVDSPTNNFATLNPLIKNSSITYSEGNLAFVGGDADYRVSTSTMAASSGKWYAEFNALSGFNSVDKNVGIYRTDNTYVETTGLGNYGSGNTWSYGAHGNIRHTSVNRDTEATFTNGDIIQVAMDLDNNKLYFGKNNTWVNSGNPTSGATGTGSYAIVSGDAYHFAATTINSGGAAKWVANFGQDSSFAGNKTAQGNQDSGGVGDFYYAPPTGFLALCTSNLPDVAVIPSEHFNAVLYTGNGSTQSVSVGFKPDFVWGKDRVGTDNHHLFDIIRGTNQRLISNQTAAENTEINCLNSFDTNGFTLGSNTGLNANGEAHVAWNWKANGSGSSNTNGSINTTKTSANVNAGFSISTYTGTGSTATVGHGLGVAPELIIIKNRDVGDSWAVFHNSLNTYYLTLDTTAAQVDNAAFWNDTSPTSTVFTVNTAHSVNADGENYIAYCWRSIDGYSKVNGFYIGNASTDGVFNYCGFSPKWIMIKRKNAVNGWYIYDTARTPNNVTGTVLLANTNAAEATQTYFYIDILSNGWKARATDGAINTGGEYIFMAFAETPFKYSNAR